jgi:hypothetical protein
MSTSFKAGAANQVGGRLHVLSPVERQVVPAHHLPHDAVLSSALECRRHFEAKMLQLGEQLPVAGLQQVQVRPSQFRVDGIPSR